VNPTDLSSLRINLVVMGSLTFHFPRVGLLKNVPKAYPRSSVVSCGLSGRPRERESLICWISETCRREREREREKSDFDMLELGSSFFFFLVLDEIFFALAPLIPVLSIGHY